MPQGDPLAYIDPVESDPLRDLEVTEKLNAIDDDSLKRRSSMYAFGDFLDEGIKDGDLFDNFEARRKIVSDTMQSIGDETFRAKAELKGLHNQVSTMSRMADNAVDPEAKQLAHRALALTLQEKAEQKAKEEAEREWSETLVSLRDGGQENMAAILAEQKDNPDVLTNIVNIQQSRALVMRAIEDAGVSVEDRGWFFNILDNVSMLVPVSQSLANTGNYDTPVNNFWDWILSGQRQADEGVSFWNDLLAAKPDEKAEVLKTLVDNVKRQGTTWLGENAVLQLQTLNEFMNSPNVDDTNSVDVVINIPTLGGAAKSAVTAPYRMVNSLIAHGAYKKAAQSIAKTVDEIIAKGPQEAAKTSVDTLQTAEESILPTQLNSVTLSRGINPISGDALDILENGRQVMEEFIGPLQTVERLSEPEKAAALDDLVLKMQRVGLQSKSKRKVIDQKIESFTHPTGQQTHQVTMVLGRAGDRPSSPMWYKTELEARKQGRVTGVQHEPFKIAEGEWGIKVSMPLDETGESIAGARTFTAMEDKAKSGVLGGVARYVAGGKINASKDIYGLAALSKDKQNKVIKKINTEILPIFYKLSPKERETLAGTFVAGERKGLWFTEQDLDLIFAKEHGTKASSELFKNAYYRGRDINDLDYYLRNLNELVNLSSQGYEKVTMIGSAVEGGVVTSNAKIYRLLKEVPNEVVHNLDDNITYVANATADASAVFKKRLSTTDLENLQKNSYVMVRTQQPQKIMVNGQTAYVRYFLTKGAKLSVNKLDVNQLPYHAGGHRMYSGSYFVKKAVRGKQPWGEAYLDTPFTPTVANTRAEAVAWAKAMNEVQTVFKNARDTLKLSTDDTLIKVQEALDALDPSIGRPSGEEFMAWMLKHGADDEFEAMFDREMPAAYSGGGYKVGELAWGETLSGINTYMQSQGRMYTSSKGPILRNIQDFNGPAETLDPYKVLNAGLVQIARMTSLQDFKIRSVQKWITTYSPHMQVEPGIHPMRAFMEGKFRTGTKDLQQIATAANIQRDFIKRVLGWKSEFDLGIESSTRHLIESVAGDKPGLRNKLVNGIGNWFAEKDPVSMSMGLAFDATMGMFNVAQFPLQLQTTFALASIDASKTAQSMTNLPAIWMYLAKGSSSKTLKWMIGKGWHKLAGFDDPDEYIAMMDTLKNSGYLDGFLTQLQAEFGPNAAMGMMGQKVDTVRQWGRVFVNKAEEINKINAWQVAWRNQKDRMLKAGAKSVDYKSPRFVEDVRSLASTFTVNMDEAAVAYWQRNSLTKLPTQFMSYMARWHEMFLNPDLTLTQKVRFALGQFAMYGTAGVPVVSALTDYMQRQTGKGSDITTFEGMVDRGLWDTLIFYTTGADVLMSERAGIGAYPTDLVYEMLGQGRYGETSTFDMLFGASGQILGQAVDSLGMVLKFMDAESGGKEHQLTERSLKRLARSISSVNNAFKAEAIINLGKYTNRKGEAVLYGLPDAYGIAALFGLSPAQFQEQTAQMGWMEDRKAKIDTWTEQVIILRQELADASLNKDYARGDEIAEDIYTLMNVIVPQEVRGEVKEKAYRDPRTETIAASIQENIEKEQAEIARRKRINN